MTSLLTSIKRTPYQSLAAFLILFFTLFMTLFFFHLNVFFNGVLSHLEAKPQVTVYFKTNTGESEIFKVKEAIVSSGKSSSVKYVSREKALEIYRSLNKDNPLLLEMVSAEILPASLEIFAQKPSYLPEIANFLKKQQGVDEVSFQKNVVDELLSLTNVLRKLSLGIFLVLILISVVVLMTTTAFKIALRKDEFELLGFLGASDWYIRKPFLNEGMFFGWVSGTAAWLAFYGVFFATKPLLTSYLSDIQKLAFYNFGHYNLYIWPPSPAFIVLTYFLVAAFGAVIGLVGNLLSTSKYIK